MSDLAIIKQRIFDEDRLYDIYEAIGLQNIKYRKNRIEAQLPDSDNKRSVQTKLTPSLNSYIRNKPEYGSGDIFSLVSFVYHGKRGVDEYQKDLFEVKKFICQTLGWIEFLNGDYTPKVDYVAPLKALLKGRYKRKEFEPNPVLPDDIMNDFYIRGKPVPYAKWIEEGISYETQVKFGVGIDLESHRIVFPLKNREGKIVGVKGRIIKDDDDPDRKYLYLYRCNNSLEWFGLHLALPHIVEKQEVIIFESEKSVMKAYDFGIYNALAIGASDLSQEQADMIRHLGLNIKIILAYDQGITIEQIQTQAEKFRGRTVNAIYDTDKLLGEKNSPVDEGYDKWSTLLNNYCFVLIEND